MCMDCWTLRFAEDNHSLFKRIKDLFVACGNPARSFLHVCPTQQIPLLSCWRHWSADSKEVAMEDFPTFLASRRSSILECDGFWPQGFGWSVFGVLDGRMVWLCDGWIRLDGWCAEKRLHFTTLTCILFQGSKAIWSIYLFVNSLCKN